MRYSLVCCVFLIFCSSNPAFRIKFMDEYINALANKKILKYYLPRYIVSTFKLECNRYIMLLQQQLKRTTNSNFIYPMFKKNSKVFEQKGNLLSFKHYIGPKSGLLLSYAESSQAWLSLVKLS